MRNLDTDSGGAMDVIAPEVVTRADLIDALGYLNETAKAIRRKGYTGTASQAYARQHSRIDAALDLLDEMA